MAGEQFDPQIREAQLALAHDPTLAKQHAADISLYYGQSSRRREDCGQA
jgi:hypothetical protein